MADYNTDEDPGFYLSESGGAQDLDPGFYVQDGGGDDIDPGFHVQDGTLQITSIGTYIL